MEQELDEKISQISPSDFRFYNVNRILLLYKKTSSLSVSCKECNSHRNKLEELVNIMPKCFDTFQGKKYYEKTIHDVYRHLNKKHKIKIAGYYKSLYIFISTVLSIALSLILVLFMGPNTDRLQIALIIITFGMVIGIWLGTKKEKDAVKNDQLI